MGEPADGLSVHPVWTNVVRSVCIQEVPVPYVDTGVLAAAKNDDITRLPGALVQRNGGHPARSECLNCGTVRCDYCPASGFIDGVEDKASAIKPHGRWRTTLSGVDAARKLNRFAAEK